MKTCQGMTLVEQLAVLAITSILVSGSLAGFKHLGHLRADSLAREVQQHIHFARSEALALSKSVYVCPSNDGDSCDKKWASQLVIYLDRNGDRLLDSDDRVLRLVNLSPEKARIKWRAFGNKAYLQFVPSGMTNFHNGTFTICPENNDPLYARNLIINVAGRSYPGRDRNANGIAESASGNDIRCS